ncbi:MAG: hypothetical protein K6T90_01575 [Leptolyngbyaceae cyanobacterium HOT.MB2.61]|nr:hypothetical protein [Leptolyngbyaceae cyanobacterium HOT.MB2.61]
MNQLANCPPLEGEVIACLELRSLPAHPGYSLGFIRIACAIGTGFRELYSTAHVTT